MFVTQEGGVADLIYLLTKCHFIIMVNELLSIPVVLNFILQEVGCYLLMHSVYIQPHCMICIKPLLVLFILYPINQ